MSRAVVRTRDFAPDAAEFIVHHAREALSARGGFRIALAGGNTPKPVHAELVGMAADLPWEKITFTFGDERCVPPTDEQSNYRMANQTLFTPAHVPETSVLRMRGEIEPSLAAEEYEQQLATLAKQRSESVYEHDLILLGMGDDGHTASLFPGTAALNEKTRGVVANFVPKLNAWRLTMTIPLIAAARQICFLVNANKQPELLDQVLSGDLRYPAAQIAAQAKNVTWILGETG